MEHHYTDPTWLVMIADSTMVNDSYDEHQVLRLEPCNISVVILTGRWLKELTGSYFDWSSQSAKAKAKERGNPNRKHWRFRGRAFPELKRETQRRHLPFLCSQRLCHEDFDPNDDMWQHRRAVIGRCYVPFHAFIMTTTRFMMIQ